MDLSTEFDNSVDDFSSIEAFTLFLDIDEVIALVVSSCVGDYVAKMDVKSASS